MPFTPEFLETLARIRAWLAGLPRALATAGPGGAARLACAAALWAAHGALLWLLVSGVAAPALAKRWLALEASAALGRSVRLEELAFDPFRFALRARGFSVTARDGGVLASFERLELDLDPLDLASGRAALRRFHLDKPSLRLVREADGSLNVSDLLPAPGSQGTRRRRSLELVPPGVRFRLEDIRVSGGSVVFDDRQNGELQELTNLSLDIESLSSDQSGPMELFSTRAELNRSRLTLTVSADLSGPVPELQARLDASDLELKRYTPYLLPLKKPLDAVMAEAGFTARLLLPGPSGGLAAPRLEADGRISGLALDLEGRRVASAESVEAQGWTLDFADGGVRVDRLEVRAPELRLTRDAAGGVDLAGLFDPAVEDQAEGGPPPAVRVGEAVVSDGSVWLRDEGLGLDVALTGVKARLEGLDSSAGNFAELTAEAAGDRFRRMALSAKGGYSPLDLTAEASLDGLDLGNPLPSLKRLLPKLTLAGTASAKAALRLKGTGDAVAGGLNAEAAVKDLKVVAEGQAQPLLAAQSLAVSGAMLDASLGRLRVGQVRLSGGGAALSRDERGGFPALEALAGPARTQGTGPGGGDGPSMDIRLDQVRLENFSVDYRDPSHKTALRADLDELSAQGFAPGRDAPLVFAAKGRLQRQAAFSLSGEARPMAPSARLTVSLTDLPLADAAAVAAGQTAQGLPVAVQAGRASLSGEANVDLSGAQPKASFKGEAGLSGLKLARPGDTEPWLALSRLAVKGAEFELAPLRVRLASLALDEPFLALSLDKEGRPVPPVAASLGRGTSTASAPASGPAPEWGVGRLEVRAGRVVLSAGMTDPPLPLELSAVEATVLDLSSASPARLDLKLKAGEWGWGWLAGQAALTPQGPRADIKAALENLDLSELSPLVRRYTGFPVARGKLWLKTDCRLDVGSVDMKNNIVASGIQLGRKAPVPGGGDVPLDLAVSLLTNAKGVIDLDIPVSGKPDAAKADLRDVISTATAGAFARIMFSPLAFLNVGQGSGEVVRLGFEPGSAELTPEARKTLDALGAAVAARPKLSLEISAWADPVADPPALAKARSRPEPSSADAPQPTPEPGPADLDNLARQRRSAVMAFLAKAAKLPGDRLYAVNTEAQSPPKVKGQPDARAEVRLRY
ncbi:hypothetical protein NNJEOMEG_03622 [Fundidesulfovibrio magnetotacticus]|uniref:OmpA-like domain-containing protein n=1 Tax=Fundidesulfovibrio magnetotacticus TaxID=2730080 RepID=A0A6V8LVI1_9BACT|nr:DUF748 domain-containing protein [Fundidesulfovibrio magnetotacticus]GFK95754.1 hypothetical protein NNJEOMEG_03622 [Fundidesulfovibrio magnetotacticus]